MRTAAELQVTPLTGALGAVIRGVDLRDLDDETWAAVRKVWLDNLVVFFPEQQLAPEHHAALGRRFGEIEIHPFLKKVSPEFPEVIVLDTPEQREEGWHTDVTFSPRPPMASILRMVQRAPAGGDTMWSNQHLAYERLSPPMRAFLDGLTAVHSGQSFGRPEFQAEHPIVRIHPETGRKSLFVNRQFTSYIPALHPGESDALLEYLYSWSERPAFQCRYSWSEGDVGIWDNRATMHNVVGDYHAHRVIHRVTILDSDNPTGIPTPWEHFDAPYRRVRGLADPEGYAAMVSKIMDTA